MTIRETIDIQKKIYRFSLFKPRHHISSLFLCLLFVFSCPLLAQEDSTIISGSFEDIKPTVKPSVMTNVPTEVESAVISVKEKTVSDQTSLTTQGLQTNTDQIKIEATPKQLVLEKSKPPIKQEPVIKKDNGINELKEVISQHQDQIDKLTLNLSKLRQKNQELDAKLSLLQKTFDEQDNLKLVTVNHSTQNKHPELKAQIIKLAIQTSLLKPETLRVEDKKEGPTKKSAWYEKLVVIRKVDKNQKSTQEKTPLYAVLKQYDLLQLALEQSNQQQWQDTLQSITNTLQSQYPQHAQTIVQELTTLQSHDIASSEPSEKAPVDEKFGIK